MEKESEILEDNGTASKIKEKYPDNLKLFIEEDHKGNVSNNAKMNRKITCYACTHAPFAPIDMAKRTI